MYDNLDKIVFGALGTAIVCVLLFGVYSIGHMNGEFAEIDRSCDWEMENAYGMTDTDTGKYKLNKRTGEMQYCNSQGCKKLEQNPNIKAPKPRTE